MTYVPTCHGHVRLDALVQFFFFLITRCHGTSSSNSCAALLLISAGGSIASNGQPYGVVPGHALVVQHRSAAEPRAEPTTRFPLAADRINGRAILGSAARSRSTSRVSRASARLVDPKPDLAPTTSVRLDKAQISRPVSLYPDVFQPSGAVASMTPTLLRTRSTAWLSMSCSACARAGATCAAPSATSPSSSPSASSSSRKGAGFAKAQEEELARVARGELKSVEAEFARVKAEFTRVKTEIALVRPSTPPGRHVVHNRGLPVPGVHRRLRQGRPGAAEVLQVQAVAQREHM
jgi:hypothetical protein